MSKELEAKQLKAIVELLRAKAEQWRDLKERHYSWRAVELEEIASELLRVVVLVGMEAFQDGMKE